MAEELQTSEEFAKQAQEIVRRLFEILHVPEGDSIIDHAKAIAKKLELGVPLTSKERIAWRVSRPVTPPPGEDDTSIFYERGRPIPPKNRMVPL